MLQNTQILGHPITKSDIVKFASRYTKVDEHWIWHGNTDHCGLGRFWIGSGKTRRLVKAHRFAYAIDKIDENVDNLSIKPICGKKLCVNPWHLMSMQSTPKWARGARHKSKTRPSSTNKGERHGRSKLTTEGVKLIRNLFSSGHSIASIHHRFVNDLKVDITENCIYKVAKRRSWTHVSD